MTTHTLRLTSMAVGAWLTGWCAPAFAQHTAPVRATLQTVCSVREAQTDNSPPAEDASTAPEYLCAAIPIAIQSALVLLAPVVLPSASAFAQSSANPPDE